MTGYESKRAAAQDKLDDDDTQVYQDHDDALTIAYQSGYYDGKKAAQPVQEPTTGNILMDSYKAMQSMKVEGPHHVVCQCDRCKQPAQEPVTWMGNKDFEPIRVRIMQEAYELADRNDSEGYNAIKAMCGDVQRMLPPQRTWVDLTDGEIAELHYEIKVQLMGAYKIEDIYRAIEAKLKEKNT